MCIFRNQVEGVRDQVMRISPSAPDLLGSRRTALWCRQFGRFFVLVRILVLREVDDFDVALAGHLVAQDEALFLEPIEKLIDVETFPVREYLRLDAERAVFQASLAVSQQPSALRGRDDLFEASAGWHGGESQAGGSALRRGRCASEKAKAEEDYGSGSSPARAAFGRQSGLVNGFRV